MIKELRQGTPSDKVESDYGMFKGKYGGQWSWRVSKREMGQKLGQRGKKGWG